MTENRKEAILVLVQKKPKHYIVPQLLTEQGHLLVQFPPNG